MRSYQIKEFDILTYKESSYGKYIERSDFDDLESFILEYTAAEGVDAYSFMTPIARRGFNRTISVKNYVGLVQTKTAQFEILPKIVLGEDSEDMSENKRIFLTMLRSMKEFNAKSFNLADLDLSNNSLYEIFISMYLSEVAELIKKGLRSAYVNVEDNITAFKGRLLVGQQITQNLAHKERFCVSYDIFSIDRAENRIIKATLMKLNGISRSTKNKQNIRLLMNSFENVGISYNYEKDFASVIKDRSMKAYELILIWSRIFLQNRSFSTFKGTTNSRALLFPMEKVFESYVADKVKKHFSNEWHTSTQDHRYYLFSDNSEEKSKNIFALEPDIVISNEDRTVIMDTKWKRLDPKHGNYGISQADMYQMYAYGKKYSADEIWLLYPKNEHSKEMRLSFDSLDNVNVKVHFVDLKNADESIEELKEKIEL